MAGKEHIEINWVNRAWLDRAPRPILVRDPLPSGRWRMEVRLQSPHRRERELKLLRVGNPATDRLPRFGLIESLPCPTLYFADTAAGEAAQETWVQPPRGGRKDDLLRGRLRGGSGCSRESQSRPATTRDSGEVEAKLETDAGPPPPFYSQRKPSTNGPAHRGEAIRSYLATPDLHLRLVALPAYSPDFNADEAVWDWAREEVTANECLGTKAQVQEKMNAFFDGLTHRKDEVRHRCRTLLQARADALMFTPAVPLPSLQNVVPTLALV